MKNMIPPFLLAIICFLLVILEGTFSLIYMSMFDGNSMIVSHFMFVFLIYVTIYFEKSTTFYAIALSILFSFIVDIVYTDIIGVYVFAYTVVLYGIRVFMKVLQSNFFIAMIMTIFGIVAADILIFLLYNIIQVHQLSWDFYLLNRLIPSLIWNVIISLIIYICFAKRLEKWSIIKFEHND
ncbi:rod shape-determining protein MreD [Gracilibacillus boraciitolerans JCM 21714]|uniref:Rod shape-determining protein MreD n=1 Tax=Gracilibacillus boraciitolerans JCM 21714 TaxID=1298598 RepID=W4VIN1_9BACI|nr:rod shape-determining protein MreD [Gracilibacillus boraciitolerans]GAE92614.1 rod shape-determining protein MreD [Gracilibacillus boraciitolerans JCM 21714]